MKDNELLFDRKCHVLYSRPCKKEMRAKIALHYPAAERETIWEQVQRQYADFLSDWRTDLGGKKNFHNGVGGTYDCIAIMSYYTVCNPVTSFREIEEKEENLIQMIADYASVVREAGKEYSPALIANYTYDLVKEYNQFYHDFSILREENEEVKEFRLVLSANVAKIVKSAMSLLGIEVPERM